MKFDISNNNVCAAGGKALAAALNGNQVMTELNLARNSLGLVKQYGKADMSGVMDIANTIPTMGALEKLLMGANGIKGEEAGKALGDAIAVNTVLKELDLSGGEYDDQKCDAEFAKGFSVGIGANGALASLDLRSNRIPDDQETNLRKICDSKSIKLKL